MILERKNIRAVAIGGAIVGVVCLWLSGMPASVQMTINLFFLVVVLFVTLLQDRKLQQQTLAATPDHSSEAL